MSKLLKPLKRSRAGLHKNDKTGALWLVVASRHWKDGGKYRREVPAPLEYSTDFDAAETWAQKKILEWKTGVKVEKISTLVRVEELIDEQLTVMRSQLRAGELRTKTISTHEVSSKHVKPWFNQNSPYAKDLTKRLIDETYFLAQRELDETRYLGNDIKLLRKIVRRAADKGIIPHVFQLKTRDEDGDEDEEKYIPIDKQDALVYQGSATQRLKAAFGLTTGMRNAEIKGLRLDQIDQAAGLIRLEKKQSKTRSARVIWLNPFLDAMIDLYRLSLPKGAKYLFESRLKSGHPVKDHKKAWASHKTLVGLNEEFRFHNTRATFLTNMGLLGVPSGLVCPATGLSVKVYEERYLKPPAISQSELEELISKLHSRADTIVPAAWRKAIKLPGRGGYLRDEETSTREFPL